MPRSYLPECNCGSGNPAFPVIDARGIFVAYCCDDCRRLRLAPYRPDIFTDASYETDEPIDED